GAAPARPRPRPPGAALGAARPRAGGPPPPVAAGAAPGGRPPPRRALEQPHSEVCLELLDLRRGPRPRQPQRRRCGGEGPGLDHPDEELHGSDAVHCSVLRTLVFAFVEIIWASRNNTSLPTRKPN